MEVKKEEGALTAVLKLQEVCRRVQRHESYLREHEVASGGFADHGEGGGAADKPVADVDVVAVTQLLVNDDLAGPGRALPRH